MGATSFISSRLKRLFTFHRKRDAVLRVPAILLLAQIILLPINWLLFADDTQSLILSIVISTAIALPITIGAMIICTYVHVEQTSAFLVESNDPTTGLPNRQVFLKSLAGHIAPDAKPGTLVIFDIDHFDIMTATYGRATLREAFRAVAHILRTQASEGDTIARLSDGEFAIFLNSQDPMHIAKLCATVTSPKTIDVFAGPTVRNSTTTLSLSAGAVATEASLDMVTLLSRADTALYRAKSKGRGHFILWTEELEEVA